MVALPSPRHLARGVFHKLFGVANLSEASILRRQKVSLHPQPRWLIRRVVGGPVHGVEHTEYHVALSDPEPREIRLVAYAPKRHRKGPRPLIMHFHGGGFVLGGVDLYEHWCGEIANRVNAVVVSVEYRLAPQHQYPAALEDCWEATRWAVENAAELGADAAKVGVVGDSAGGNLAATVTLKAREAGMDWIRHQALVYPVTDFTESLPSHEENSDALLLSNRDVERFNELYLPEGQDLRDPYLSPLFADHRDLPPGIVVVAGKDVLRDDGIEYANKLRDAGSAIEIYRWDQPHGFTSITWLKATREALTAIVTSQRAWLR